jgi:alkylation response protein AidB-like acyl-CoA dehydrogenase
VIELDDRLLELRDAARECGGEFRSHALAVDERPDCVAPYLSLPGAQWLARLIVPPQYTDAPLRIGPYSYYGMECLERVVSFEALAYGDAGLTLACPGPSMSGIVMSDLGSVEQCERYYGRVLSEPTWTFFALTEPAKGSDASELQTALSVADAGGGLRLDGVKRYIGNGTRAQIGVVFARSRPGPLGIEAVLVDTAREGFAAEPLEMVGLRGARIAELRFDGMPVDPDAVLGAGLPASRRGLWAAVMTFNRLRPAVGAAALGVAEAACDYVRAERRQLADHEAELLRDLYDRLAATRQLLYEAALTVDADPRRGALASAAKLHAVRLAERCTLTAAMFLGPGSLLEHPLLEKWLRDARGFEFMEGTSTMQKLNVFAGLQKGQLDAA